MCCFESREEVLRFQNCPTHLVNPKFQAINLSSQSPNIEVPTSKPRTVKSRKFQSATGYCYCYEDNDDDDDDDYYYQYYYD